MGRLFQYNRFGNAQSTSSKDNITRTNSKSKENEAVANCPAYSELYPEYSAAHTTLTTASMRTTTTTTMTTTTTTMTAKSVELAIKKYQQWSSKLLLTTSATVTATATATASTSKTAEPVSQSTSCTSTTSSASHSCSVSASSGYHSHSTNNDSNSCGRFGQEGDREMLVSAVKRPKVYDCMKDFLKRKLFQPHASSAEASSSTKVVAEQQEEEDDDATSDYDELDMLDSSYNADEEDATDCSSDCTYPIESSSDNEEMLTTATPKSSSPQKSVLSLNCWQHSFCTDATTDGEEEESTVEHEDDSDAGISDCCQLIAEKSPKRRGPKKVALPAERHNVNDEELPELLESPWYQPRITTKAAVERLQAAQPGSFLVRRKARTFELCVRVETKVKQFTVISGADNYKLKGARKQFSSLKALITHHSVMAEQLPLTLALPREKQQLWTHSSLRCADDFDTFESLQILGILKSLQARSLEFS